MKNYKQAISKLQANYIQTISNVHPNYIQTTSKLPSNWIQAVRKLCISKLQYCTYITSKLNTYEGCTLYILAVSSLPPCFCLDENCFLYPNCLINWWLYISVAIINILTMIFTMALLRRMGHGQQMAFRQITCINRNITCMHQNITCMNRNITFMNQI